MPEGISADLRGIGLELKLVDKRFASAVRKEIRTAVTNAGAEIVQKIRDESSWSTRIPGATTIRPNFSIRSAGVRIVTSRATAPHARPLEMGNQGGSEQADTFTHPTPHGGEATQAKRPFFFKSVEALTPETEAKVRLAVDLAVRAAGFR